MTMKQILSIWMISLMLSLPVAFADPDDEENTEQYEVSTTDDANSEAMQVADQAAQQDDGPKLPSRPELLQAAPAPAQATKPDARKAAKTARKAAVYANRVAKHSVKIIGHSKKALKHALGALHDARVDSGKLGKHQKKALKKAEAHLREATKTADYGKLQKLQEDLDQSKSKSEREQMRREIQELRKTLKEKNIDDKDIDQALDDLETDLTKSKGPVNDESKAELERLRQLVDSLDTVESKSIKSEDANVVSSSQTKALPDAVDIPTPVEEKGLDIDTQMPYGELEPFGREDTAQELTESSIKESDEMVDQLERAEVAEEKRAVFRALTRLRGAAITSFDGVARSQTGNIDEYNKIHQWRSSHPLHHLADEESDVSKWAFPDNAD